MLYGTPPFPMNVQKSPGEQAFAEVRAALKEETKETPVQFMMESKKLCLAIVEAYEIVCSYRRRSAECDQATVLKQEIQYQLMAFALMRVLSDDDIKGCAIRTHDKFHEAASAIPPMSKSGLMVKEMESLLEPSPELDEAIKAALVVQPLFRIFHQKAEVFAKLEQHYPEIAHTLPNLVAGANESLVQFMQMQSRPPSGPL